MKVGDSARQNTRKFGRGGLIIKTDPLVFDENAKLKISEKEKVDYRQITLRKRETTEKSSANDHTNMACM